MKSKRSSSSSSARITIIGTTSLIFMLLLLSDSLGRSLFHTFLDQHVDAYPYLRYKEKESTYIVEDNKGIPYVNYGHIDKTDVGFERSPVTVAQKAISNYHEFKRTEEEKFKELLINNTNWLIDNAVYHPGGNFSILEYRFPWPVYNLTVPWRSAMAQAQAIEAMTYAYQTTNDKKYLDTAKLLLDSFFIEVKDGGVTDKLSSSVPNDGNLGRGIEHQGKEGWWYELFAGSNKNAVVSKVLNGHMFTLMSIHKYYQATHDEKAKYIFNQGVIALKWSLPYYDNDSYSYYDSLKKDPTFRYHYYHIKVLNQLYDITHEEIFWDYSKKWRDYFKSKSLFYEEVYNRIIRRYRL